MHVPTPAEAQATATTVPELLGLLRLEPAGPDRWAAGHSAMAHATGHVYGGLVAAQAVVAAYASVPDGSTERPLHSLHAYFLRPGDPGRPLELVVERTRDGRGFSHRRVSAEQGGVPILQLSCSFAVPRRGLEHQPAAPAAPPPEGLLRDRDLLAGLPGEDPYQGVPGVFEHRSVTEPARLARDRGAASEGSLHWVRLEAEDPVADDPVLQQALLVYAGDLLLLDPTTRPHALSLTSGDVLPLSLDHAMWFHAPLRLGDWFLHETTSPWAGAGRASARGRIYDRAGTLVAETAQEGLLLLP